MPGRDRGHEGGRLRAVADREHVTPRAAAEESKKPFEVAECSSKELQRAARAVEEGAAELGRKGRPATELQGAEEGAPLHARSGARSCGGARGSEELRGAAEAQGARRSCRRGCGGARGCGGELRRAAAEAQGAAGCKGLRRRAAEGSCGGAREERRRRAGGELRRSKVVAGVPRGARSGAADAQGASRGG